MLQKLGIHLPQNPHPSKTKWYPSFTTTRLHMLPFSLRGGNLTDIDAICKSRFRSCKTSLRLRLLGIPCTNNYNADSCDDIIQSQTENHQTDYDQVHHSQGHDNNFWGAVSLIIGTAVGPGMLGLPAQTIRSGPLPSTIAILLSWVYVISSIILVAHLSFSAMEQDGVEEVSFTSLATNALGTHFGAFVAVVYACLSFALLVACVSGIGSIVSQWFPQMNLVVAHALFPLAAGSLIILFPFNAIDVANRCLCFIMLFSITSLVAIGLSVARSNLFASFGHASWNLSSILPAIPVTVLTLGFHVVTPFICKIAGNTIAEARRAILIGGAVPLVMVLSWNSIVLGLSCTNTNTNTAGAGGGDPMALLLSVNPSALSAVQGFAFSALATSLIGYAVSFPKQLLDTLGLIGKLSLEKQNHSELIQLENEADSQSQSNGFGRVGFAVYSGLGRHNVGYAGRASFTSSAGWSAISLSAAKGVLPFGSRINNNLVMPLIVLGLPVLIASFFRSTFSRALDFAGLYANCFLFGILPPAMAYIHQSRNKSRSSILPGGDATLLLLFGIAVILGIWH